MSNIDQERIDQLLADADDWGPNGPLGKVDATIRGATPEESSAIDDAMGLQMISIRLQRGLLHDLKMIAEHHRIGYQPMIRDLLNRFVRSEIQTILQNRLAELAADVAPSTAPVEKFMRKLA